MMWDKRYKDPSDPTREYTRNHLAILRIEDGRIQGIWDYFQLNNRRALFNPITNEDGNSW